MIGPTNMRVNTWVKILKKERKKEEQKEKSENLSAKH